MRAAALEPFLVSMLGHDLGRVALEFIVVMFVNRWYFDLMSPRIHGRGIVWGLIELDHFSR